MSLPGCYLSHSPRDLWLMTLHKMPSPAPAPFLAPQPLPVELVWLDAAILARGSRRTGCSSPAGLSRHGRLPTGSCAQEPHEHPHCSSAVAPRLWPRARWEAGTLGQEEPQHSCRPSLASHRGKHLERIGAAAAGHVGLSGASTGFTTASLCPSALPQHRGSLTCTVMRAVAVARSPYPPWSAAWISSVYSGTTCGKRLCRPKVGDELDGS